MAELPIMPLKTDALISDTCHMSAEEFGVYCRILCAMWRYGARLPDSPDELARIGGVTLSRWKAMAERVLRPMSVGGGFIMQKRMTTTWMDVQALREKRAKAANKRWGKNGFSGNA